MKVLAEVIGGTQRVLPVSGNPSMPELAALIADAEERSLQDDSGSPVRWILYVPNGQGGFAPAGAEESFEALQSRVEAGTASSAKGFAGAGELEGEAYAFRIRLFIPPSHSLEPVSIN